MCKLGNIVLLAFIFVVLWYAWQVVVMLDSTNVKNGTRDGPKIYTELDPELIELIKEKFLIPPSSSKTPYNFGGDIKSDGQSNTILEILNNKKNGFFIECGANNGVFNTNTLLLEKEFGWTGILIEAGPKNLESLYKVNRRSWIVPAGLSIKKETMQVEFGDWAQVGQIIDTTLLKSFEGKKDQSKNPIVTCLPFFSILLALDNPTIDYFSLDVEGYELDILKTIPWDKVNIKVLSVEFIHLEEKGWHIQDLQAFMISQGYIVHSKVKRDFIFIKNEYRVNNFMDAVLML